MSSLDFLLRDSSRIATFASEFDMIIKPGASRYRNRVPDGVFDPFITSTEEIPYWDLTISAGALSDIITICDRARALEHENDSNNHRLQTLLLTEATNKEIRDKNPAVLLAYDRYQTLLNLTRNDV